MKNLLLYVNLSIVTGSLTKTKTYFKQNNFDCVTDLECRSKHCVPVCGAKNSKCVEARDFYTRHSLEIPKCVEVVDGQFVKQTHGILFSRLLGETCHNQFNCLSRHCIQNCENPEWTCIEPKIFYERNKLEIPKCIDEKKVTLLKKLQVPTASRGIGETCNGHSSCTSGNCVHMCDNPSVSQCIEPRWSFIMYKVPIPECVAPKPDPHALDKRQKEAYDAAGENLFKKQAKSANLQHELDKDFEQLLLSHLELDEDSRDSEDFDENESEDEEENSEDFEEDEDSEDFTDEDGSED